MDAAPAAAEELDFLDAAVDDEVASGLSLPETTPNNVGRALAPAACPPLASAVDAVVAVAALAFSCRRSLRALRSSVRFVSMSSGLSEE